jgi:hypothetical protein
MTTLFASMQRWQGLAFFLPTLAIAVAALILFEREREPAPPPAEKPPRPEVEP